MGDVLHHVPPRTTITSAVDRYGTGTAGCPPSPSVATFDVAAPTAVAPPGVPLVVRVTGVAAVRNRLGAFNPHTTAGAVVVDGFVVSTWTAAVSPRVATAALTPARWAYAVGVERVVGGSLLPTVAGWGGEWARWAATLLGRAARTRCAPTAWGYWTPRKGHLRR